MMYVTVHTTQKTSPHIALRPRRICMASAPIAQELIGFTDLLWTDLLLTQVNVNVPTSGPKTTAAILSLRLSPSSPVALP